MAVKEVVQIAAGHAISLALNKGGLIHTWGQNNEALGYWDDVICGHVCYGINSETHRGGFGGKECHTDWAVTKDGELFTWGMNVTHELRLGMLRMCRDRNQICCIPRLWM
jgi:alpha-tubulin suppressor-like RCC1 family protein